jgi:hypothetical protein
MPARWSWTGVQTDWIALQVRPVAGLAEVQEPSGPGSEARGWGGLREMSLFPRWVRHELRGLR